MRQSFAQQWGAIIAAAAALLIALGNAELERRRRSADRVRARREREIGWLLQLAEQVNLVGTAGYIPGGTGWSRAQGLLAVLPDTDAAILRAYVTQQEPQGAVRERMLAYVAGPLFNLSSDTLRPNLMLDEIADNIRGRSDA